MLQLITALLLFQAASLQAQVSFAPTVTPLNGIDDIPKDSVSCGSFYESLCKEVDVGEGRFADCLMGVVSQQETDAKAASTGPSVSEACINEILEFRISRSKNINFNLPLAKACNDDAQKFCTEDAQMYSEEPGFVISCLR